MGSVLVKVPDPISFALQMRIRESLTHDVRVVVLDHRVEIRDHLCLLVKSIDQTMRDGTEVRTAHVFL